MSHRICQRLAYVLTKFTFAIALGSQFPIAGGQDSDRSTLPVPSPDTARRASEVAADYPELNRLITRIVLENIPHAYTDQKHWGMQRERWDGIEWRCNGLKIEAERRRTMANDGTWRRYTAELVNPEQEFEVAVQNFHQTGDGKLGFDVSFAAHLRLHARQSQWIKGLQLYSLSADGRAKVRLHVSCQAQTALDLSKRPPDLVFQPNVVGAKIIVDEFQIDRISKVGGEFADQITRGARKILDEKIEEKQHQLVERLNRQLAKDSNRWRLSIIDAIDSQWAQSAIKWLPSPIQQALIQENNNSSKNDGPALKEPNPRK